MRSARGAHAWGRSAGLSSTVRCAEDSERGAGRPAGSFLGADATQPSGGTGPRFSFVHVLYYLGA